MFEVCCRLCLEQVPLQNIHSLYGKHKEFLIRDKIYELFQVQFSDTEKLSTVCNDCLEKIETVDTIRTFFLEADKKFKTFLTASTDEPKGKDPKNIDEPSKDNNEKVTHIAPITATTKSVQDEPPTDGPSDVQEDQDNDSSLVDSNDKANVEVQQIIKAEIEAPNEEPDEVEMLHSEHEFDHDPDVIDVCDNDNVSESEITVVDLNKLADHEPQSLEDDDVEPEYAISQSGQSGVIYTSDQSCDLMTLEDEAMSDIITDEESSNMRDLVEVAESVSDQDQAFSIVTLEYQCNVCNDIFENLVSFIQHTNSLHIEDYPHHCKHCYLIYKTKEELVSHDCAVRPKIFECSDCPESFQTVKDLRQHTQNIHNAGPQRKVNLFKCDYCSLILNSNQHLLDHVQQVHPEDYVLHPCDRCDRTFGNTQTLRAHLAAHERNYKCNYCGKLCPTAVSLAGHENTHTKEQPFQCAQCGRNFAQYTSMRRHMKIHFNEKAYQCDFCPKRFRQRTVMLTHRRIHTGEKPFSCGTCSKAFRDHSTLAKHKRIHEKKVPAGKK